MNLRLFMFIACTLYLGLGAANAQNYSTGAVDIYNTCGAGPDLPQTIPEAANARHWWDLAGFPQVSRGDFVSAGE